MTRRHWPCSRHLGRSIGHVRDCTETQREAVGCVGADSNCGPSAVIARLRCRLSRVVQDNNRCSHKITANNVAGHTRQRYTPLKLNQSNMMLTVPRSLLIPVISHHGPAITASYAGHRNYRCHAGCFGKVMKRFVPLASSKQNNYRPRNNGHIYESG